MLVRKTHFYKSYIANIQWFNNRKNPKASQVRNKQVAPTELQWVGMLQFYKQRTPTESLSGHQQ